MPRLGFYLSQSIMRKSSPSSDDNLLLAPFAGKPACQLIRAKAGKGVCADAFVHRKTVLVADVEAYPGHIACDGDTKSEIVLPMVIKGENGAEHRVLGVMDLDCLALGAFDEDDKKGLEAIVEMIVRSCDW